jgi:hypothetical protein
MKLLDGDTVLVKVNKFTEPTLVGRFLRMLLAKSIQFFDGVYYHHSQKICDGKIWEADWTFVNRPVNHNDGDSVKVLRLKTSLSPDERSKMKQIISEIAGRPYDKIGLVVQLFFVLSSRRIWIGSRGDAANRKLYCTEATSLIDNQVRGYFPQHWLTSPYLYQLIAPYYYDVVYEGIWDSKQIEL